MIGNVFVDFSMRNLMLSYKAWTSTVFNKSVFTWSIETFPWRCILKLIACKFWKFRKVSSYVVELCRGK